MADRFTNPRQLFYTIDETAEALRVSDRTIQRMIKHGKLPAYKVGSHVRVRRADLDDYLREHRFGGSFHVL
ncbi:helix-turn-helix domain-containing protein [Georhizobium sp. MAB10]|uniref:helix-turn-helix domain-containing protein n=1 Tax=Georhizobium sp. MAB10 TaxID=3028319 RepID=UPI00385594EF